MAVLSHTEDTRFAQDTEVLQGAIQLQSGLEKYDKFLKRHMRLRAPRFPPCHLCPLGHPKFPMACLVHQTTGTLVIPWFHWVN